MTGTMTETISDTVCLIEPDEPEERTPKAFPLPGPYRFGSAPISPTAEIPRNEECVPNDNTFYSSCHVSILQCLSELAELRDLGGSGDPQEPLTGELIFSDKFQFTGEFSSAGGILQGDSDVKLVVPENAIPCEKKITIGGAVCVDLKTVHTRLGLKDKEFICSPVIEYVTDEEGFRFQKPVQIDLPRFQPHLCSAKSIKVYRCNKQDNGEITREKLEQQKDSTQSDGTYFLSEDGVHVLTSHFTSFMTTVRRSRWAICFAPPVIHMWLYGEYIQDDRDKSFVVIKLLVSDDSSTIRDFRKAFKLTEDDEAHFIQYRVLPDPRREDFKACLQPDHGEQWEFKSQLPQERTRDVYKMESPFHCFEWALTSKTGHAPGPRFTGVMEAGYGSESDEQEKMHINIQATTTRRRARTVELGIPGISGTGQTAARIVSGGTIITNPQYVNMSGHHDQGTTVTGSGHQVGNTHTEDRHDQHIEGSYN